MKTLNYVIVKVEQGYNNEVELQNGSTLVVNTTIESVEHINRTAIVESTPEGTVLQKGDEVVIHHNICRLRNGTKGEKIYSNYHLKEDLYIVPLTELFMFKREGGEWEALDPYCFVRPIKIEREEKKGSIFLPDMKQGYKGNVRNIGFLIHVNKELKEAGFKKGDKVIFSKYSEYEFNVEGEILYKMSTRDILAKLK